MVDSQEPPAPRRPEPGHRNVLITSALPYVNNVPHLGNIIGCVLSADCYARYCRSRGYNTLYICGTDEYGTATETKALEEKSSCQEICDKYNAIHAEIYRWFNISFNKFGRTPTEQQTEIVQSIFNAVKDAGLVEERDTDQLYSPGLQKFLADRYVTGTCPKCGYEDARGDQCDNCTTMLNPTELINPKCKFTGTTPELRSTRHIFLDLPALSPPLQEWITTTSDQGGWSSNCLQVTKAWMRDGLKQRCITRDLKWGVPVPVPGFEDKVFYVWFDACIGYISITANYMDDWQSWWQNPEDVELVQFMGKDNVPFHTVMFPAILLGTGGAWTKMRSISVTEYLNYEGAQFSKSRGIGVFGNDAKETGIPADVWRYYLLSNRPEQSDTDFKWTDLQARNNAELLNNLGNFINRVLKFIASQCVVDLFDGRIPAATAASGQAAVAELGEKVAPLADTYLKCQEARRIRRANELAMEMSREGNGFIQQHQLWEMVKTDREQCGVLVAACAGLVTLLAGLIEPYMPGVAAQLCSQLNVPAADIALSERLMSQAATLHRILPEGHQIGTPEPLFRKVGDAEVAELRKRFAGSQDQRKAAVERDAAANGTAGKAGKAEKGSGKKGGGGRGKAAAPEGPLDISRLNLRVGEIKKVWRHPGADSLYCEEVDIGEEALRQVVSGLVKFMSEEQMLGARVVIVANMKPASMRGVRSQAMLLCASNADGSQVEFVEPPAGAAVGTRVTVEGFPGEPDEVLNPKKKVFETVQPELKSDEQLVATYKGVPLATAEGSCTVKSVVGGSIR